MLDFGYWEDTIKADGWNFKRDNHDESTKYRIKDCFEEMNKFYKNPRNRLIQTMELEIIMGIASWEDEQVFNSILMLRKAMNKIVLSSMVFINHFFQYLFKIALTVTKFDLLKQ